MYKDLNLIEALGKEEHIGLLEENEELRGELRHLLSREHTDREVNKIMLIVNELIENESNLVGVSNG